MRLRAERRLSFGQQGRSDAISSAPKWPLQCISCCHSSLSGPPFLESTFASAVLHSPCHLFPSAATSAIVSGSSCSCAHSCSLCRSFVSRDRMNCPCRRHRRALLSAQLCRTSSCSYRAGRSPTWFAGGLMAASADLLSIH